MAWYSELAQSADAARLSSELSALRKEMALIQRKLAKKGRAGWSEAETHAADFYEELRDRVSDALPAAQQQMQRAASFAQDNRKPLILGTVAVVGLLALLAMRRR